MSEKITIIRDFDAVYQAKLFLEDMFDKSLGIENAMKGLLRITYLTSNQLNFFYAEVFDGIFLLDWGPSEIAKILGLPENSKLPITIYSPETNTNKLKEVIKNKKVSSKLAYNRDDSNKSTNNWLFGKTKTQKEYERKGDFDKWHHDKSNEWLKAIKEGNVELKDWSTVREFNLDIVVKDNIEKLKRLPQHIVDGINQVLNISKDKVNNVSSKKNKVIMPQGKTEDERATVLDFIDKSSMDDKTKFLVFWWWNNLYMKAIANKYHASYITFYPNVNLEDIFGEQDKDNLFSKLKLKAPKTSKLKIFMQNLSSKQSRNKTLLINGNILEDLMKLTEHSFKQVQINVREALKEDKNVTGANIYDISYIVSNYLNYSNTYRSSLKSARLKLLAIGIPSIFVLFYESGFLFTHNIFKFIWIISIVILAIPWKEINDMMRLRKSNLSATITEIEN